MLEGNHVASDEIDPEDMEELEFEEDLEAADVDPEELDEEIDELDDSDEILEDAEDADAEVAGGPSTKVARKGGDEEDDEEDLLAADDVEEDLDKILKDKLTAEDAAPEDEEEIEVDDRSAGEDRLQPKRPDERLCSRCFLLVRDSAPACPVGDDSCPIFAG